MRFNTVRKHYGNNQPDGGAGRKYKVNHSDGSVQMTFNEALNYVYSRKKFAKSNSLERISALLFALSEPQKKLRFIHVLGTNGKGSVSTMTASCLTEAGYKTGLFTSPFVESFCERIQINSRNISEADFCRLTETVRKKSEDLPQLLQPTFFEFILAVALVHFCEQGCDFVVLEAGIGGRDDSTNIIPPPLVTVFTSISLDHTEILGDTAEKIAEHKAGAIKEGSTVVSFPAESGGFNFCPQQKSVCDILRQMSEKHGCRIVFPSMNKVRIISESIFKTEIEYGKLSFSLRLPGEHQLANAACVIETVNILRSLGYEITDDAVCKGMERAFLPARTEIVCTNPLTIIDGGHNEGATKTLCGFIDRHFAGKSVTLLAAYMKDKDYRTAIDILAPRCENIVFTICDEHRGEDPAVLSEYAKRHCKSVHFERDTKKAFQKASALLNPDSVFVIAGSFYLAGELRKIFSA